MIQRYFINTVRCSIFAIGLCAFAVGQTDPRILTRSDVVINPKKPSVYLCVDRNINQNPKPSEKGLWIRVNNNTVWTLQFDALKTGGSTKILKLSNGNTVPALSDGAVAFPIFGIERKISGRIDSNYGGVRTGSWLPSNSSAIFKVRAVEKEDTVFIEYRYEWEIIGTFGRESHAPIHRVYLQGGPRPFDASNSCD